MKKHNIVFNNQIEYYGHRYLSNVRPVPNNPEFAIEIQKRKTLAILFEQFLLFDKLAIKIDRNNLPLIFLIQELGINKVEELLERDILRLVLWTPVLFSTRNVESIYEDIDGMKGVHPIMTGEFKNSPEESLDFVLNYFHINKERKKIFKKKAMKQFVLLPKSLADDSKDIVYDAYQKNRLNVLGLKFEKELLDLNTIERDKLINLSSDILETIVVNQQGFKGYDNNSYFNLTKNSITHIESALKVSENTSKILTIENVADIQSLVFENKIPLNTVFDIRYKSTFKEYRKWINEISVSSDVSDISKEYINELSGKNKFFESTGGKFLRTMGMCGAGAGLGVLIGGSGGAAAGVILSKVADVGLALMDTYVLDGILKGWNPRMFVEEVKKLEGNS